MLKRFLLISVGLVIFAPAARATYSIVACDSTMQVCGVAVQTNNLAVGASVPYAKAGVGAIAAQFETNPMYGSRGLALLAAGKSPEETVRQLLAEDGSFEGEGPEARQVGIVSVDGRSFAHTGEEAAHSKWAGSRTGNGYSIQGNGLAGAVVVDAMEQAFLRTKGSLAERLMAALTAGDQAGGQRPGRESAALLVSTPEGFPLDIDLRVDHSADPVGELRTLLNIQMARQQIVQARIAADGGQLERARVLLISGVSKAPMWPRIWIQAARVAASIDEPELAVQYLNIVFVMNPAWAESEIGSGRYAQLGVDPLFHRWVSAEQQRAAVADSQQVVSLASSAKDDKVRIANRLLEVGKPNEALTLLVGLPSSGSDEVRVLRASAYAALGRYEEAVAECKEGAEDASKDSGTRSRCRRWRAELTSGGGLR